MTDTVTAKLTQWAALTEGATEGPWEAVSSEVTMNDRSEWRIGDRSRPQVLRAQMRSADAEFIAAARTAMPALVAAVQDVLTLIDGDHCPGGCEHDAIDAEVLGDRIKRALMEQIGGHL